MFFRGTPTFLLIFGVITLTYGTIAWLFLRAVGALGFVCIAIAALLPVAAYIAVSLFNYGYDAGWPGAALAFGIPALLIGCGLWIFTVRVPL